MTHRYHPLFCEENIWQLNNHPDFTPHKRYAVFISNHTKSCALWSQQQGSQKQGSQKSAPQPGQPVIWDYHVILLANIDGWRIWDLDSVLPPGININQYLSQTFVTLKPEFNTLKPRFRLVEGDDFAAKFSSDRRYMQKPDGSWLSPPPPWPLITQNNGLTLPQLLDMGHHEWLSLSQLWHRFCPTKD